MQLNQSTDYAIRMILYLAKAAHTVPSSKLSAALGISSRYLLQIGARLRDAGMVQVSHGNTGGYLLAKNPEEITVYEIIRLVENKPHVNFFPEQSEKKDEFPILNFAYRHMNKMITKTLQSMTVESLLKRER